MAVALSRCGGMTGGSSAEVFSDSAPVILKEYRSRLVGRHGVVTTPCLRVYHSAVAIVGGPAVPSARVFSVVAVALGCAADL